MSEKGCVIIDPGHGGKDPGAVRAGIAEKDVNLAISWEILKQVVAAGIDGHLTRTVDKDVALAGRSSFANVADAGLVVSIHCNASDNPSANGVEVWHYPTDKVGANLASRILSKLVDTTGWRDRGVKSNQLFWMLRKTKAPAVIVECGFISNPDEAKGLIDPATQKAIASAIASAIIETVRGVI